MSAHDGDEAKGPMPLEARVGFLLSQLGMVSAQDFAARLEPLGLTPNRYGLLVHVSRAGAKTQQQLAATLGIHRNTMVSLIDDLEAQGLVERRPHPTDRRAHLIALTASATALLPAADRLADEHERALLDSLNSTERAQLRETLQRIARSSGRHDGVHPGLGAS